MRFGSDDFSYSVVKGWGRLPQGWRFGWMPGVAVDSRDRVYVYSRSEHPLVVFSREGDFVASWGEDVLEDAHGIFIDGEDNVYCVDRETHCVRRFEPDGSLSMTLGTPGLEGAKGEPFQLPTDLAIDADGFLYVTDGYGNFRVHKFTAEGQLLKSWGREGSGPGEFQLPHGIRVDPKGRLLVADRTNNRIQLFDTEGTYLDEWTGLHHPDSIHISEGVVYVAELDQRVSIWTLDGRKLTEWGGGEHSSTPGEFAGAPHGICTDSRGDLYVGQVHMDGGLQKFTRQKVTP